jgi:hypothetical protein
MAILWPAFALFALTMLSVARLAHSAIHVTSNKLLWRFRAFFLSWLVLLAYWVALAAALREPGAAVAAG